VSYHPRKVKVVMTATSKNETTFQKIPVKKKVKAMKEWQKNRKANRKAKQQMQERVFNNG
jgi:hypothetical protein